MRVIRKGSDNIDAYVEVVGRRWTLLRAVDDNVYWGGFEFVRTKHVTKVKARSAELAEYSARATATWPDKPQLPSLQPDARTEDVLQAAQDSSALVTIHIELEDPGVCFIGKLTHFHDEWIELRQISPSGAWDDDDVTTGFTYKEITRVQIGDRYQEGLARFGDPYPPASGSSVVQLRLAPR